MSKGFLVPFVALMLTGWSFGQPPAVQPGPLTPFWPLPPGSEHAAEGDPDTMCFKGPCPPPEKPAKMAEPENELHSNLWISGEYLLWTVKRGPLPAALVTTSPVPSAGLTPPLPGAIGGPNTTVVYGGNDLNYGEFSGGRLTLGAWNDDHTSEFEARAFVLERRTHTLSAASDATGRPALFIPFFNPTTGLQDRFVVSDPEASAEQRLGRVAIPSTSRLWGGEANVGYVPYAGTTWRWTLLAGFRYLNLTERVDINQSSQPIGVGMVSFDGVPVAPPAEIDVTDTFRTQNQFYAGQVGTRAEYAMGIFYLDLQAKLAFGANNETQDINGQSNLVIPGAAVSTLPGGHFAVGSNVGNYTHHDFSLAPEFEARVGVQIASGFSAFIGYDFLYWTNVIRPGNQIDTTVDQRQVPTSPAFIPGFQSMQPAVQFRHSDFWAQGVSFGVELQY